MTDPMARYRNDVRPGAPVRTSVAMTAGTEGVLRAHLLRADGQEDICLATYRPSTGATRRTALLRQVHLPEPGEREVHGNATITGDYVLRSLRLPPQTATASFCCTAIPAVGAGKP